MSDLLLLGADGDSGWGQMGILAHIPSSIHPFCSCPRPASTSDLLLVEADGVSALDRTQQDQPSLKHFVSLGQTDTMRLPLVATLKHLWLPNANFNVVSAASGGRWGFCGCHCSQT